jgi:hypothetical protein
VTINNQVDESEKILHIYVLSNTPLNATISPTYLSHEKDRISENVVLDHNRQNVTIENISRIPKDVRVSINLQEGGIVTSFSPI